MARVRLVPGTLRGATVALTVLACLGGLRPASAEESAAVELVRELGSASRSDLALEQRVAAARRALTVESGGDAQAWRRAGMALLRAAPEPACWLLRRALREGLDEEQWAQVREVAAKARPPTDASEEVRQRATALAFLLGERALLGELVAAPEWPVDAFVRQVLADEVGHRVPQGPGGDLAAVRAALREDALTLADLDRAAQRDPQASLDGLSALMQRKDLARPLLAQEARLLAQGSPPGLLARRVTAVMALGQIATFAETAVLIACLESPEGWGRAAAATALGVLKDPAAAVALARQLVYAGDPFRARESWDYPGTTETTLTFEEWQSVEYYVIDVAAADALLSLGARGAAGWLIRNCLDPSRRNLRIRVPQDALASLRRHLPATAPLPDALADGGLPQRWAAFEALEAWWRAHRDDDDLLRTRFAEQDPGYVEVSDALAAQLGKPKVLELMIAKDTAEVLGSALTPALVRAAAATTSKVHKVELATALGRVRDPRAVGPLLALAADPAGFVRAAATLALGSYAPRHPQVVDALLARLDDDDCGTRVAALKGLCGAPCDPRVSAALRAHDEAAHAARCGADSDYGWAAAVVRLAQRGSAAWPAVEAGLVSQDRVVRRTVWDLLRVALDLPEHAFDPIAAPQAAGSGALDAALLTAALAARGVK